MHILKAATSKLLGASASASAPTKESRKKNAPAGSLSTLPSLFRPWPRRSPSSDEVSGPLSNPSTIKSLRGKRLGHYWSGRGGFRASLAQKLLFLPSPWRPRGLIPRFPFSAVLVGACAALDIVTVDDLGIWSSSGVPGGGGEVSAAWSCAQRHFVVQPPQWIL